MNSICLQTSDICSMIGLCQADTDDTLRFQSQQTEIIGDVSARPQLTFCVFFSNFMSFTYNEFLSIRSCLLANNSLKTLLFTRQIKRKHPHERGLFAHYWKKKNNLPPQSEILNIRPQYILCCTTPTARVFFWWGGGEWSLSGFVPLRVGFWEKLVSLSMFFLPKIITPMARFPDYSRSIHVSFVWKCPPPRLVHLHLKCRLNTSF